MDEAAPDQIAFESRVIEWRGPAPFYFATVPEERARALRAAARRASYGWGCVPVIATVKATRFRTSLFPKDGSYLLPLKAAVRRELAVAPGDPLRAVLKVVQSARAGRGG